MKSSTVPIIGWREWVSLPTLRVLRIKAKVDTGARTSSLHAFDVQWGRRRGVPIVRFEIHPYQRGSAGAVLSEQEVVEQRWIRSSNGSRSLRPVIVTDVIIGGLCSTIELTLTNRDDMGFRMLLGRQAVRDHFLVDPGRSFLAHKGRSPVKRKKRKSSSHQRRTTESP